MDSKIPKGTFAALALTTRTTADGQMVEAFIGPGNQMSVDLAKTMGIPAEIKIASICTFLIEADHGLWERFQQLIKDCGTVLAMEMTGMPPAAMVQVDDLPKDGAGGE